MTYTLPTISTSGPLTSCWFCHGHIEGHCRCGRTYCGTHGYKGHCLVCALGLGLFDAQDPVEPISDLIMLSVASASGDPYIVVPPTLAGVRPIPLPNVEKLVGAMIQLLRADDAEVRRSGGMVLARTTNSWPTMDPSRLAEHSQGMSLLAVDQVRYWLLYVLKQSRTRSAEPIALAILDKLRTADFRDLYPVVVANFQGLTCSGMGARVHDVLQGLAEFYPTSSYAANEGCELFIYEQYTNRHAGMRSIMERLYGPKLRHGPLLAQMLKKGVWQADYTRFYEWYPGEEEPR